MSVNGQFANDILHIYTYMSSTKPPVKLSVEVATVNNTLGTEAKVTIAVVPSLVQDTCSLSASRIRKPLEVTAKLAF
jgi:hypothetical protein